MESVECQLPVDRPTLKGAQEHKALSRVRKIHDEYLKVVEASEAEGIDVLTKLKNLGFQRIEDFYLSCPHFGFGESTRHLGELGSGYVCFFDFVKFVCILLLVYFGINCFLMFAVYTPDKAEAAKLEWGDGIKSQLISALWRTPWVLGWNSTDIRPIVVFSIIFLLTVIAVTIYEGRQKKLEADIDSELTFPDDYAVLVRGLPTKGQAADEVDIQTFFEDYGIPGAQTQVVKVVIGWDMKQFNDYNFACAGIMKQVQSLQERGVHARDPKMSVLQERLNKIRDSLLSVREGTETELQGSGVAIVSFRFQSDHRQVLRWWNGRWMRLLKLLRIPHSLPKYKGKHAIQVERAPHPDEILWMDLAQPSVERWKRWCFSWFCMLLMLCALAAVSFFVERSERKTGQLWYSLLAAGVIATSNMLLVILCRFLSSFEFHDTVGDEISALIWKMSLVMVLNTIGLPLFANYWYDQTLSWYTKTGLVYDITMLIIVNPLFQALILRAHIFTVNCEFFSLI